MGVGKPCRAYSRPLRFPAKRAVAPLAGSREGQADREAVDQKAVALSLGERVVLKDMERKLMDCKAELNDLDTIKPDSYSPLKILMQKVEMKARAIREREDTAASEVAAGHDARDEAKLVDPFTALLLSPRVQKAVRQVLLSAIDRYGVGVSTGLKGVLQPQNFDESMDALDHVEVKDDAASPGELEEELSDLLAAVLEPPKSSSQVPLPSPQAQAPSSSTRKKTPSSSTRKKTPSSKRRRPGRRRRRVPAASGASETRTSRMPVVDASPEFYVTDDGSRLREVVRTFGNTSMSKIRRNHTMARLSRSTVSSRMSAVRARRGDDKNATRLQWR